MQCPNSIWSEGMGKLALVATIKTITGKRDEYLKHLKVCSHRGAGPGSMVGGLARGTGLEDIST